MVNPEHDTITRIITISERPAEITLPSASGKCTPRGLSVMEAQQSDEVRLYDTYLFGLWHRGTPLGGAGYFGNEAYDFFADDVSYHILTVDGILGRDTLR